eukprot:m.291182 g.291182  ORF g.291182 m.291182 type:complete len:109 (-) comp22955_c1_seq34:173-499(-)
MTTTSSATWLWTLPQAKIHEGSARVPLGPLPFWQRHHFPAAAVPARQQTEQFRQPFASAQPPFSSLQEQTFEYVQAEMVVNRVLTLSVAADKPAAQQAEIRERILGLL